MYGLQEHGIWCLLRRMLDNDGISTLPLYRKCIESYARKKSRCKFLISCMKLKYVSNIFIYYIIYYILYIIRIW